MDTEIVQKNFIGEISNNILEATISEKNLTAEIVRQTLESEINPVTFEVTLNQGIIGGTFLELGDTPDSYDGQEGKLLAVKPTKDGIEFVDAPQGVTDHSQLTNLDYAHAGHTGFQPSGNYFNKDSNTTDNITEGSSNLFDKTVSLTSGTGINITGTYPSFSIENTAPDQTVGFSGGTNVTIGGTYPNFTITDNSITGSDVPSYEADTLQTVTDRGYTSTNLIDIPGLQINTSATPVASLPGLIQWNSVDGTFDMGLLNGSILQVGQEMYFYGKASGNILNGDLCQFAGVQGDHILIKKAVGSEIEANPHFLVGVATENISNGNFGYVTWFGKVNGIYTKTPANQDTADWVAGDILYFNVTTGQMTKTVPSVPNRVITVAAVIKEQTGAAENGIIIVRPMVGKKLSELDDVNGTPLTADGQILNWHNTEGYWDADKNINDYTPLNDTSTFLKLDQTTPQTVSNGRPTFTQGINSDLWDGSAISVDAINRKLFDSEGNEILDWNIRDGGYRSAKMFYGQIHDFDNWDGTLFIDSESKIIQLKDYGANYDDSAVSQGRIMLDRGFGLTDETTEGYLGYALKKGGFTAFKLNALLSPDTYATILDFSANDGTFKFPQLTTDGFIKTSGSDGSISIDTNTYLTTTDASTTYAKLDGTNQPFTGDLNVSKSSAKITATNTGGNAKTISLLADNSTDASYIKGVTGVPASTPIGLNVDGVGLTTSDTSTFNFAKTDPFSVEFWFSGSTVYPFNFTEWLGTRGGVGAGWVLSLISTNNTYNTGIALQLYDSGGNYRRAYAYSSIYSSSTTNGAYKHIVFVSNGDGTFNLYINGSSTSITTEGTAFASLGDIAGGKALTMSSSVSDYDPRIDELVIWNKALSGGEISARYASGAGLYQTETAETLSIWHFDNDKLNSVAGKNAWTDTSGTSTFVPGVVTAPPSDSEVQVIKLSDGISAGAKGTLEFGNVSSDTVLNGGKLDFSIANTVKATMRSTGMDYQTKLGVLTPTVISEGSAEFSALTANNYPLVLTGYAATTGARPFLLTRQARGTISSPTATQSGDIISGIGGRGYYTGSFSSTASASHIMWAAENFTSTAQGTYQTFTTTPTGSIIPAERLRITSDGNVGIGTTAPSQITHIKKDQNAGTILLVDNATNGTGAGAFVRVQNNTPVIAQLGIYSSGTTTYGAISGGDASVYTTTSLVLMADNGLGQIKFASGGTGEKMRLTEAGRLGIGTTTPSAKLHVSVDGSTPNSGLYSTDAINLSNTTSATLRMITSSDTAADSGILNFVKTKGTLVSPTIVSSGDTVGTIGGQAWDGASRRNVAQMLFEIDGTPGSSDMPGRIVFKTTPDGSATIVERMRISNSGNVGIGVTAPTAKLHLAAGTAAASTAPLKFTSGSILSTDEAGAIEFLNDDYFATITTGAGGSFTSEYPTAQNATYVKATSAYNTSYYQYFCTDPAKSLIGGGANNQWLSNGTTNQRLHIDLGSAKVITRIYYENGHDTGTETDKGAQLFTIWGSNTASAFADTTYATDTNWTQLTASQSSFDRHAATNTTDPKYISITNTTAYQYYAIKIANNYGGTVGISMRRLVLQTSPATSARKNIVLTDNGNLTSGRVPYATTNGRLTDSANLTYNGTDLTVVGRVKEQGTYAGIHFHDASTAQSIPTGTTYTKLTAFTDNDPNSNATSDATNDKITITKAGKYLLTWHMSFQAGSNNILWKVAPFLAGTEINNIHQQSFLTTGSDSRCVSASGIITATANQDVDLRVRHDNGSSVDITPIYGSLTVNYLGE